jgi:small-conductance mechanosensitive channel
MNGGNPLITDILRIFQQESTQAVHLWQLAVVAVAIAVGWITTRAVRRQVDARVRAQTSAAPHRLDLRQFSIDGVRRLAFPVVAMAVIVLGSLALRATDMQAPANLALLRLALFLFGAMALVRLFVYVLRRSFPRSAWIGNFERLIALVIWLAVALHVTGLLGDLIDRIDAIALPVGKSQISLWDLLIGAVSVVLTMLAAMWLGSVIEARLMAAASLTANSRVVLSRLVRALLVFVAVLVALSLVGIDLTVLSVFGGALGVGLGLGLQRIASNYVSGFIILLDRSLTIGDMITVDKFSGAVKQINTRYTVIKALDGTETIVPNEMLVAAPVINHSYADRKVRVVIKLSVAYGSDVDHTLALLPAAARTQDRVLAEPAPAAFVTALGAEGIDLELAFWVRDPDATVHARSDVSRAVLQALKDAGIAIPVPQRELPIRGNPQEGFSAAASSA